MRRRKSQRAHPQWRSPKSLLPLSRWPLPPVFELIREAGSVPEKEMFRVFNMGIGLVLVVSKLFSESILAQIEKLRVPAGHIGEIDAGKGRVVLKKM